MMMIFHSLSLGTNGLGLANRVLPQDDVIGGLGGFCKKVGKCTVKWPLPLAPPLLYLQSNKDILAKTDRIRYFL